MIATISPFRMSRSSPRSAWTSTSPLSYVLTRLRATTIRSSTRRGLDSLEAPFEAAFGAEGGVTAGASGGAGIGAVAGSVTTFPPNARREATGRR